MNETAEREAAADTGGSHSTELLGAPPGYRLQPIAEFDAMNALTEENDSLRQMVDRAHDALNELLAGHLNIASEAAEIAKRGLWGEWAPNNF